MKSLYFGINFPQNPQGNIRILVIWYYFNTPNPTIFPLLIKVSVDIVNRVSLAAFW